MSVSASEGAAATRGAGSVVICDSSGFNLRFLRAAMTNLQYGHILEAKTLEELFHKAEVMKPDLVVFDPAMEDGAGVDAIHTVRTISPDTVLVAFCSEDVIGRAVNALGITTVPKRSLLKVDVLVAAIEHAAGRTAASNAESIPAADVAAPVWDEVPSLVDSI